MNSLITLSAGTKSGRSRAAFGGDRPKFSSVVTGPAIRRWLRQAYGLCKLVSAPREALLLATAPAGGSLALHLATCAPISSLAAQPFVCSNWSSSLRLRRMIEHCAIVDRLGRPFNITSAEFVELIEFDLDDDHCRWTLDKAAWLLSDGLLCASLWVGIDRVFSISFCLSDTRGTRTAYVGGVQGRRNVGALEQNRTLTKAAHGLRPRDLAFELFRMMMPRLGVVELKCVADAHRYQKTRRGMLPIDANDKVQLDYDDIWTSRGGVLGEDGFFQVPVQRQHREAADIPAKKRSMYARRYAFLDQLNNCLEVALHSKLTVKVHNSSVEQT